MPKEFYEDKNFLKGLEFLFPAEGGYSNDPQDYGGPTNMGVTQQAYNHYRDSLGLSRKSVKSITKKEASALYYKDFWKASGADKMKDQVKAIMVFDTAVLHGPYQAQFFFKKSRGDINKYLDLRKQFYDQRVKENPSQQKFYRGWINRINNLKNFLRSI